MKKIIVFTLAFSFLFSCKTKKTVEFCEGVSVEGEGANCGETFSTGDITVIIKPESSFGVTKLKVNIYKSGKYKKESFESVSLEVDPESISTKTKLHFYEEGDFIVEVIGGENNIIAEGAVSIIDVY